MSTGLPSIPTHLGHAGWKDHEVRGEVVFKLDPKTTEYIDLALLVVGVPASDEARMVSRLCAQAGLNPDPRIPPMKLVRLGAAYGNRLSGLATGLAGLQSANVGMSAISASATFLCELQDRIGWSYDDEQLDAALHARRSGIEGFGVPGRAVDERVIWLGRQLSELVTGPRPWWGLLEAIEARLARHRRRPNLGGAAGAALLDVGCTPAQAEALSCVYGLLPLLGNAHEGATQAPALLRELPASIAVEYTGRPARTSPRAQGRDLEPERGAHAEPAEPVAGDPQGRQRTGRQRAR